MTERWLPVVGYEGWYEVSDQGRVRRVRKGPSTYAGKLLPGSVMRIGYRTVAFSTGTYESTKQHYVHKLVAEAFIGPRPPKHEVNHKDGVKTNNRSSNLEYVTKAGQAQHAVRMGLVAVGEHRHNSKLSAAEVRTIRRLAGKKTTREIGRLFGVANGHVSRIINRRIWTHI